MSPDSENGFTSEGRVRDVIHNFSANGSADQPLTVYHLVMPPKRSILPVDVQ